MEELKAEASPGKSVSHFSNPTWTLKLAGISDGKRANDEFVISLA